MREKVKERWGTSEVFPIFLGDKRVTEIVITNHAKVRYNDRINRNSTNYDDIAVWAWDCLKQGRIKSYYRNEEDVYLVDDDLVMVAEFAEIPDEVNPAGRPMHRMIVVTFLGRMSETIELRDLKSYYSWLRHSRRMTLMKNSRKQR